MLNYDIPHDPESYVHRIGRTGRAGQVRDGAAVRHAAGAASAQLDRAGRPGRSSSSPSCRRSTTSTPSAWRSSATRSPSALGAPGIDLFRKLIEGYERDNDVPMADIAAALALQSRDGEEFLMTEPPPEKRRERADRPPREDGAPRKRREVRGDLATYRIAVGKRHKVDARRHRRRDRQRGRAAPQRLRAHHASGRTTRWSSCPRSCPSETLKDLEKTRIQGQLIDLRTRSRARRAAPQAAMRPLVPMTRVQGLDAQGGLESSSRPSRVASLTGIRAVAAMLVVATHAAYTTGKYTHGYVGTGVSRMEIGVPIFFVLSGFLLFRPWVKADRGGQRLAVGAPLRVAPGAAHHARLRGDGARGVSCSTTSAMAGPNPGHTWTGLFRNLTLTQIYTDNYLYSYLHQGLTQMWSLAVEVAFYVALPMLAYLLLVVLCRGAGGRGFCWRGWSGWR